VKKSRRFRVKWSWLQCARYALLFGVVLFFVLVPLSNWYANNKLSYNHPHLVGLASGPVWGFVYSVLDRFYSLWSDPITAATSNNGSLWAFTFFGIPLSDPVGLISELLNSVEFPVNYLLGGVIPFLVALVLGRVFCAWLCPMTLLYGVTSRIRAVLLRLGVPLLSVQIEPRTGVVVFLGGLVLAHLFGAWIWHFVLPYISFTHEIFSYIVFSTLTVGAYFLGALLVLDVGLIPGQFCRSVCPTGFLLSLIGSVSVLRLRANRPNCPSTCKVCNTVCPIDLFPKEGRLYSCHLCMKCVDHCPLGNIALALHPLWRRLPVVAAKVSGTVKVHDHV